MMLSIMLLTSQRKRTSPTFAGLGIQRRVVLTVPPAIIVWARVDIRQTPSVVYRVRAEFWTVRIRE
jgi:hypothetical protein